MPQTFEPSLLKRLQQVRNHDTIGAGLPNIVYTDSEFALFERQQVFSTGWTAIGFASDVPIPGSVHPLDFLGLPLVMVRNRDGQVRVFHNVCSHRGMILVNDSEQRRTVIRCPYHSWSYDLNGTLLNTPLAGGTDNDTCPGLDKAKFGLRSVRSTVWMGIVFINLDGAAADFDARVAPLQEHWSSLLSQQYSCRLGPATSGSKLELEIGCNWKLAVENYCEAYHLPWVHPALNSYSPLDQHFNVTVGDDMAGQGTLVYTLASVAGTHLPQFAGWPADRQTFAEYIALYPNALLGLQADHFFCVIVLPKSNSSVLERLEISYIDDAIESDEYAACRDAVLQSWETVFKEDIFAVEGMQKGRNSSGFDGGALTPVQDIATRHFHQWVAGKYLQQRQ